MAGGRTSNKGGLDASKSRSSGTKGGKAKKGRARPTATRGKPGPQLPGEKKVRPTKRTVGVEPVKTSRVARTPMDPNAIDRRKQILEG